MIYDRKTINKIVKEIETTNDLRIFIDKLTARTKELTSLSDEAREVQDINTFLLKLHKRINRRRK